MQVILLERMPKLGQIGDVVNVKNGYARNFLLPQKKALRANEANKTIFEQQRSQLEARNLERQSEAEQLAEKLNGQSFTLIRSASESGQLYGSVSVRDIVDIVNQSGISVARNQFDMHHAIKTLGLHSVVISLHAEVTAQIMLNIARSEEEAATQLRKYEQEQKEKEETPSIEEVFSARPSEEAETEAD